MRDDHIDSQNKILFDILRDLESAKLLRNPRPIPSGDTSKPANEGDLKTGQ